MPKNEIDYSKTIIYKIVCKDLSIKGVYVGYTTNFVQKKYSHKVACNLKTNPSHSCRLYKHIRENGGWDNWLMVIVDTFNCKDNNEAKQKEYEYYVLLGANLNSVDPSLNPKIYKCNICNIVCRSQNLLDKHYKTFKHTKKCEDDKKILNCLTPNTQKNAKIFTCEICTFNTSNKYDYNKHLSTRKHLLLTNTDKNTCSFIAKKNKYICYCGKSYKHNQSLYTHKKKCNYQENKENKENKENEKKQENIDFQENQIIQNSDTTDYKSMFIKIMNENKELRGILINQQNQITELIPKIGNNNNNIKQNFNINVFLNEQCKDALTINQFIDSIKISIEDLFLTKNKGITEGISNIFIKNMNKLSLYERPLHCTDIKRETVYIKSEGEKKGETQWEKDKEQEKLRKAINDMTYIQSKNLKLYTDNNPDWMENNDKQNDYMKMVRNCTDDIKKDNRRDKVVKKLCNSVYYNGPEK